MNRFLEVFNVITFIVIVYVLVGAVAVLTDHGYSMAEYFDDMKWFVSSTAVGRGIASLGRITP